MPDLTWVATDLRTGLLLADLPDLDVSNVKATIGRYESTTATLPIPSAPENWQRATLEGAACLNLLSDGNPIWGGNVTKRIRDESDKITISLVTVESYLDRRYVGDVSYGATVANPSIPSVGQNNIVASLVNAYIADGAKPGLPIRVQFTTAGVGALRDRTYLDASDKTVYSALTELMGVIGGPEWTVGWEWQHNPERITPVLYVGDRIGAAVPSGMGPAATFEMPGSVISVSMLEDYSAGKGANDVMAVSSASGSVRPQSPRQLSAGTSRPTFEYRWTPSTSITDVGTLSAHAQQALGILSNGSATVNLSAVVSDAPVLGVDWSIGDDIGFAIGGLEDDPAMKAVTTKTGFDLFTDVFHDIFGTPGKSSIALARANTLGRESVPAFPGGFAGVARCIGWELEISETPIITPTLLSATIAGS
ncbi:MULTISPECIES: hypothetical protein [unclassified Cryobacterium]|uniref:hypothetical protein n=1 Tax=unclassified Cryobacterium TaxID=2649013 RepID=UPI00106AE134|nr:MULTISPECIES: hypothetical protein [unclassified Cryobacterium]TFB96518.1 hypothetical protein E3O39_10625 [Cryobacterium sp. MDB2-A-1]TFC12803.1 hypothetical protein E3O35_07790 [Cryobacterium sp. MDB2-A-2]